MSGRHSGYGWQGPEDDWVDPGSAEFYDYLLTDEERAEMEREQRAKDQAAWAAAEARTAEIERRNAQLGLEVFGRPLRPGSQPQAEAGDMEHE